MAFWQTGQLLIEIEGAVPETHQVCADSLLTGITLYSPSVTITLIEISVCQESFREVGPVVIVGRNNVCTEKKQTNS